MLRYIFDASAVLAMLQDEPGSEMAASMLGEGCITSANLSEVISKLVQKNVPDDVIARVMSQLGLPVLDITESIGERAGYLYAQTHRLGLSLGDRLCLAATLETGLKAITADTLWTEVGQGTDVVCIR